MQFAGGMRLRCCAAIWRNETENGVRHNATLSRLYRDHEGNWKNTQSFGRDDLLVVAKVANEAHTKVFELQRQEQQQTNEPEMSR